MRGIPFDSGEGVVGYRYHTFTMELLPHEMRILLDSNVVRRFPDRLTPMDHKDYDYITKLPRAPADAYIGEFDTDPLGGHGDPFGSDTTSITYRERKFFEQHDTSSTHGCWDVNIGGRTYHAAHHRVDYIDILDLPQGMKTAEYPN